ncbi:hypothetical protein Tco_0986499 [Tanacetum coccineum]
MNEDYYEQNSCYYPNSFGFDQYQPPQFPVNYPPQETSREILQDQGDLMKAIQTFLKEYDHIPPNEKCMALLLAEERSLKIKQVMREEQNQPEVMQELLLKLMDDLQILKGSQQEKKEFDLEDIFSNPRRYSSDSFFEESDTFLSHSDNSLPEFETFSDHTEETRSGSTTTHANNSLPEYDSFLFEIEPDQGGLTSIVISDNSNDPLLELPEFESFHFHLDPSFPFPLPEPPDVEISLIIETDAHEINNVDELNEDKCFDPGGGEINVEVDNSFTFVTWIFLPFLTYPEVSPLLSSTKNEDTIFDPDIFT